MQLKRVECKACHKSYPLHDIDEHGDCKWCMAEKKITSWMAWREKREAEKQQK